jgi:hypothetical protein
MSQTFLRGGSLGSGLHEEQGWINRMHPGVSAKLELFLRDISQSDLSFRLESQAD